MPTMATNTSSKDEELLFTTYDLTKMPCESFQHYTCTNNKTHFTVLPLGNYMERIKCATEAKNQSSPPFVNDFVCVAEHPCVLT
uniref:Uncharacterized protein n=1 Tax=Lutzomyia longipalpis TaxID=7200 RepID=A0A1B0CIF4_LUTLO